MALFVSTLILQLLCIFFNYFYYGAYSNLGASFFVVAAQTNASEAISITASMAAPKSGYYKIESCNGTWDQIYMDVQLNTNTYTYVDEGKIIGVRIIKSSGVQGRFKAKLSYKENI